jgi:hypothetical protein
MEAKLSTVGKEVYTRDMNRLTSFANFLSPSISLHNLTACSQSQPHLVLMRVPMAFEHQGGAGSLEAFNVTAWIRADSWVKPGGGIFGD